MHNTIDVKKFNNNVLSARIREIRGVLKQEQFADALAAYGIKISRSKVSRWEDGLTEPSASELAAIAAYAHCSIDEVVYGVTTESVAKHLATQLVRQLGTNGKSEVLFDAVGFDSNMYKFSFTAIRRLKKLVEESRQQLGVAEEGYIQLAVANGISLQEARLFYSDIEEEIERSHPVSRIEAFLPLIFQVRAWQPLRIDPTSTYAGAFNQLIVDLETFNGFNVHSTH